MQPKVSIIIPAYNCEKYIENCIESVINQTYKNIEILIINDGSKDRTSDIINFLASKDHRIINIDQKNSGPSVARNNGIDRSTGEYLVFVDSDDTVKATYVELLLKYMLEGECDIVCCGYKDISIYGKFDYSDFMNKTKEIKKKDFIYKVCQGTGGVLWSKIFKKEIIDKYNIKMNKDIFMCEDLIFVLQYASHCEKFVAINEYLYNYNRLNNYSISSNISKDYMQNYVDVCKHIERLLIENSFNSNQVNSIISNRIQSATTTIIDSEIKNIKNQGLKQVATNIQKIMSEDYIGLYKSNFKTDTKLNKPYIFFIKNDQMLGCIIYSYLLNMLRNFKQAIKSNKKVQMEK